MTETKTCPRCGTAIRADEGPGGLCPACLMKMGFDSRTGTASVVYTEGAKVDRPPAPAITDLAAHFPELEIRELVARGGMGCVYRARQKSLERDVALKILTVGTYDPNFAGRFEREARTLAGLSHPNIVSIIEFGQRGPWTFLTMEFVEGASLRQMMRAHTVGSRESLSIVTQMCDALQYAHDQGVVHRDIKPENVLVTRDGRVKVLDFGLAKLVRGPQMTNLTQTRQVMGTPHYMAPEQWEKPASVDHRADIYALGVVFYELLTGELPLGRFQPPSQRVAVDVRLDDVVLRSLEKEPDRRYQHASQIKDKVAGIVATPRQSREQALRQKSLAHKVALGCLAGALIGIVVSAGMWLVGTMWKGDGPVVTIVGGGSTVQQVENKTPEHHEFTTISGRPPSSASSSVGEGFVDLHMSSPLAQRFGLQPTTLDALNGQLAKVWQRYLELEAQLVASTWLPDGWLELRVQSAESQHQEMVKQANDLVAKALGEDQDLTRYETELHRKVEQTLRFGAKPEHIAISIEQGMSHSRGLDPDDTSMWNASPADAAYVRLWKCMLPSRPPQSK